MMKVSHNAKQNCDVHTQYLQVGAD